MSLGDVCADVGIDEIGSRLTGKWEVRQTVWNAHHSNICHLGVCVCVCVCVGVCVCVCEESI